MLVEDSQNLRLVLRDYFEMMNYDVIDYCEGKTALRSYRNGCCDICLLDMGSQKKDGYDVIKELRSKTPDLPVIFVTAKDTDEDRIKGFNAGFDDYLTKPFSTEELLLHVESVLKKSRLNQKRDLLNEDVFFTLGDFKIKSNELKLFYEGEVRKLTKKETQLLKFLIEHKNKVIPREILIKEIWGNSKGAMGRSLDVFISKIRVHLKTNEDDDSKSLHPDRNRKNKSKHGHKPKVELVNIHGTGYLLKIRD